MDLLLFAYGLSIAFASVFLWALCRAASVNHTEPTAPLALARELVLLPEGAERL